MPSEGQASRSPETRVSTTAVEDPGPSSQLISDSILERRAQVLREAGSQEPFDHDTAQRNPLKRRNSNEYSDRYVSLIVPFLRVMPTDSVVLLIAPRRDLECQQLSARPQSTRNLVARGACPSTISARHHLIMRALPQGWLLRLLAACHANFRRLVLVRIICSRIYNLSKKLTLSLPWTDKPATNSHNVFIQYAENVNSGPNYGEQDQLLDGQQLLKTHVD